LFRILVADDHPVVRFGLRSLFVSHPGWEVCGEASDGRTAIEKCERLKPDLVVLDIGMPQLNGLDAARQILKDNPDQRILVLTDVDREDVIQRSLEAGVRGWVFKSDGMEDLLMSVEALQRHKSIFSSRVSNLIGRRLVKRDHDPSAALAIPELSVREREVVQLIAEGHSTKEVATILNVTMKTADTHRANIMRKLELHSVAELVMYAVRNGMVQVSTPMPSAVNPGMLLQHFPDLASDRPPS
jgi:DNA-binding NarL/FixJ family response regulator